MVNAVAITAIADTSPRAPIGQTNWQFAKPNLTIEINSPGANAITWSGLVTWANGASAPTMSIRPASTWCAWCAARGRRSGSGYTETQSRRHDLHTDAQARSAVLSSTYLLPIGYGELGDQRKACRRLQGIIAGSITGTYLAPGAINSVPAGSSASASSPTPQSPPAPFSTNKLVNLPGGTAVYMDGTGNFTTPAGGGRRRGECERTWASRYRQSGFPSPRSI